MNCNSQDFITSQNLLIGLSAHPVEQEKLSYIYRKFVELGNISMEVFKLFSTASQNPVVAISHPLMAQCIENAHIAFYLSLRGFPSQSYAVSRVILEITNLIKLFQKHPEEIENWQDAEKDYRLKKTFTASNVRKRLDQGNRDDVFGFLSNVGSHASWQMICNRFEIEYRKNENPIIKTVIGGTHNKTEIVLSNFNIIYVFTQFIFEMVRLFLGTNKYCKEIECFTTETAKILTEIIGNYFSKIVEDEKIRNELKKITDRLTNFEGEPK
ncbi:MAG: hypothetical protein ABIJ12_08095 [bacterium]